MPTNLNINYLGLELISPVIVGSCPLTTQPEFVRQAADCGAGAVVLPSLFQEQIEAFENTAQEASNAHSHADKDAYNGGLQRYLDSIKEIKNGKTIPVIASLHGSKNSDWLKFSKQLEAAGADALELNFQPILSDTTQTTVQIESELAAMVAAVCYKLQIPVAVKLAHQFTNLSDLVSRLKSSGAAGVVLFSHQPTWDVCIDSRQWTTRWELTPLGSIGSTLEGIVKVRGGNTDISIAASGGVVTSEDALKTFIAGTNAVMVTSEIYRSGVDSIRTMVDGISNFLDAQTFHSLADFQQSRRTEKIQPKHNIREEYLAPLTQTQRYPDPTPDSASRSGDRFGHIG